MALVHPSLLQPASATPLCLEVRLAASGIPRVPPISLYKSLQKPLFGLTKLGCLPQVLEGLDAYVHTEHFLHRLEQAKTEWMDLSGNHGQQLPEHTAAMHPKAAANGDFCFEMTSRTQALEARAAAAAGSSLQVRFSVIWCFLICHSKKCHRPHTSSCHKKQRHGTTGKLCRVTQLHSPSCQSRV